jgi:hypothetical protein
MRRITTAATAAALALGMTLGLGVGSAKAATSFDSAYQFESAFLTLNAGDTGTFSVFFANTGATAWVANSPTQVNLAVCGADKLTCNITSPQAAWASNWVSPSAYATAAKSAVAPGDFSAFTYSIKVPAGTAIGTYRFNGDLVVAAQALAGETCTGGASCSKLHAEGYYQDVTIANSTPASTLSVSPAFGANEDNTISSTVPGNGQHTYTFTTTLTGTLTFAVLASGNVVQNADGTYSFCDTNQDKKADGVGAGATFITAINGVAVPNSSIVINQPIPSNGQMTVTIDSATPNERVRLVAWQDKNQNGQLDLTNNQDNANCDTPQPYDLANDGAIAVAGRKYYFPTQGQFGGQFASGGNPQCEPVWRHDPVNQAFSAGPTSQTSLRFNYDSNDIFQVTGTQVSLAVFKAELAASMSGNGSTVKINYDPNPSGFSTFNICTQAGAQAPSNVSAATGNFDSGSAADDVRISFTAPSSNTVTGYNIQRASLGVSTTATTSNCNLGTTAPANDSLGTPAGTSFSTVGAVTVSAGATGSFTNFDLANGGYCYRVFVQDPNTGQQSFSNYVPVNIPGTSDSTAPTSTRSVLTSSSGFANTLDQGDKIVFDFQDTGCGTNCGISVAANAVIRVTDSDCGPATNAGPATCSGGNTNTVADIICGSAGNATCTLQDGPNGANTELSVTMTSNPTVQSAGSTAGAQYPVVVTDSSGITDLSGNAWNLGGSADRVFGPQGN